MHLLIQLAALLLLSSSAAAVAPPAGDAVGAVCNNTIYPQTCTAGITAGSGATNPTSLRRVPPTKLVSIALKAALAVVHQSHTFARTCYKGQEASLHLLERQAVQDCVTLMAGAKDQLNLAIANLSSITDPADAAAKTDALLNLNVWLSSALSFQSACADGFLQFVVYGRCERPMLKQLDRVSQVLENGLDLVKKLAKHGDNISGWKSDGGKRYKTAGTGDGRRGMLGQNPNAKAGGGASGGADGFPSWLRHHDRQLLKIPGTNIKADLVVAQDGTGKFRNVSDAVNWLTTAIINQTDPVTNRSYVYTNYQKQMAQRGLQRFVIYIKSGVYVEQFEVPTTLVNLTFVGDGVNATVISGSNNVGSGLFNTYRTPTVAVTAAGFMARDITFRNTAGPAGYQAVALRAEGDLAVFYRCSMEGYQDTLYALAGRQFYKECQISGTVDFIFGNAIATFQGCQLLARRPLPGQQNTLTAQGRRVDVDITGFAFQNCSVTAAPELAASNFTVQSYLGRPWKAYSRTVFMQSFLDGLIHPAGWLPWNASNPFIDTVYYGEFQNSGPGSPTDQRVTWPGVHANMNASEAALFTADNFILASTWLPLAHVTYLAGLGLSYNSTT